MGSIRHLYVVWLAAAYFTEYISRLSFSRTDIICMYRKRWAVYLRTESIEAGVAAHHLSPLGGDANLGDCRG